MWKEEEHPRDKDGKFTDAGFDDDNDFENWDENDEVEVMDNIKADKKSADFFNKIKKFEKENDWEMLEKIGLAKFKLNNEYNFYKSFQDGVANKDNFFVNTIVEYKELDERPDREPDYVSNSGSEYWYSDDGVIRGSDHWGGNIASCDWFLNTQEKPYANYENKKYGKANWNDFVQKTSFVINDAENKGKISTFKNTTGGIPYSRYSVIPKIDGWNA